MDWRQRAATLKTAVAAGQVSLPTWLLRSMAVHHYSAREVVDAEAPAEPAQRARWYRAALVESALAMSPEAVRPVVKRMDLQAALARRAALEISAEQAAEVGLAALEPTRVAMVVKADFRVRAAGEVAGLKLESVERAALGPRAKL